MAAHSRETVRKLRAEHEATVAALQEELGATRRQLVAVAETLRAQGSELLRSSTGSSLVREANKVLRSSAGSAQIREANKTTRAAALAAR